MFVVFFSNASVNGIFGSSCACLSLQKAFMLCYSAACVDVEGHGEVGMGRCGKNYVIFVFRQPAVGILTSLFIDDVLTPPYEPAEKGFPALIS